MRNLVEVPLSRERNLHQRRFVIPSSTIPVLYVLGSSIRYVVFAVGSLHFTLFTMGRYSSVQAFADNHTGVQKVPYEQAAAATGDGSTKQGGTGSGRASVQPEKVVNPYGSTAGAGSGEFHVYRHARNRELQRQSHIERTAAEDEAEEQFQRELAKNKDWEEERTAKRRNKRERQKNAKKRKSNLAKAGINVRGNVGATEDDSDDDEDEFQYTPGDALAPLQQELESTTNKNDDDGPNICNEVKEAPVPEILNDGSFLQIMTKKMEEQQKQPPGGDQGRWNEEDVCAG